MKKQKKLIATADFDICDIARIYGNKVYPVEKMYNYPPIGNFSKRGKYVIFPCKVKKGTEITIKMFINYDTTSTTNRVSN